MIKKSIFKDKETFKKIIHHIKKYRILLLSSLILASLTVYLTLYIPILFGQAIDFIIEKGSVDFSSIRTILFKIFIFAILTSIIQWIMNTINNKITYHVIGDIRNEAFEKIEVLPLKYIDSHSYGEIVSKVISDVDQFADGLILGFTQLFTSVITVVGTFLFMLSIHGGITLLVVCLTPLSLIIAKFIANKTYTMFKVQSEIRGEQTAFIDEILSNEKVVQAFSHENQVFETFKEINNRLEKCSLKAIFFSSITNPGTRFINSIIYASVALMGAIATIKGSITIGGLSCFLSYANQYTKPFNEISGIITELQNSFACASRIFELIDETPQIPDKESALELTSAKGNLTLQNVSFSYISNTKLIENLNFKVTPGQQVAIVGPTGCGKSTLINLLMRFYDVDKGHIYVEDSDVRDYSRHSLRRNYGMVLQDTWLKNGTIRENITMGKPDATDDEIIQAAKLAHSHNFIIQLPNGYDSVLTEDGGNLSQGQKQLLCITRVMLCLPPMLILDEATSSIDTRTEIKIQDAFTHLMKGRTSFIVAHRLSTICNADIILVMKDGNIIEKGTHQELLNLNGFYANLYNSQFSI